jgi:hypothetical protein
LSFRVPIRVRFPSGREKFVAKFVAKDDPVAVSRWLQTGPKGDTHLIAAVIKHLDRQTTMILVARPPRHGDNNKKGGQGTGARRADLLTRGGQTTKR